MDRTEPSREVADAYADEGAGGNEGAIIPARNGELQATHGSGARDAREMGARTAGADARELGGNGTTRREQKETARATAGISETRKGEGGEGKEAPGRGSWGGGIRRLAERHRGKKRKKEVRKRKWAHRQMSLQATE